MKQKQDKLLEDYKWQGSEVYKNEIIVDLEEENICCSTEIVSWNLMCSLDSYPIYSNGFDMHLEQLYTWIDAQHDLISTGR